MPKLKKRSALQTSRLDRKRKHTLSTKCDSPHGYSDIVGTPQDADISVNHSLIDHQQPSAPNRNVLQIIGTHEYSFHNVQPDDVLHGELHIQTMDYISQTLKVQFNCQFGMLPPSYVYQLHTSNSVGNFQRVPSEMDAVQIHFIQNHFIVSAQINKQIYIYDSLLNRSHVQAVKGQLHLIYESSCEPVLLSPQSQGSTLLCGFFAVANAITLLQKKDPSKIHFLTDKMRTHLHECLIAGKIDPFPHRQLLGKGQAVPDSISAYFLDQKKRQAAKQLSMAYDQQEADISILPRKIRHTVMRRNKRTVQEYKNKERARETKLRREIRKIETYKEAEITRETKSRTEKRKAKPYKQTETTRETKSRTEKRKAEPYKQTETTRETKSRTEKRKAKPYKQAETTRETKSRTEKRKNEPYKQAETTRETKSRTEKRKNEPYKQAETTRETKSRTEKRKNEPYKQAENTRETKSRTEKRKNEPYKQAETTRETKSRTEKRKNEPYKQAETTRETKSRTEKRKNEPYKQAENTRETKSRTEKRKNEPYKQAETTRETKSRTEKRKNEPYKQAETTRETKSRTEKRKNEPYKQAETTRETKSRTEKRKAEPYKQAETTRETKSRTEKRKVKPYKQAETTRETKSRRTKRKAKTYKQAETRRETKSRTEKRNAKPYKEAETRRETKSRTQKREAETYKQAEILRDSFARKLKRLQEAYKLSEKKRETMWKKLRRTDYYYKQKEQMRDVTYRRRLRATLSSNKLDKRRQNLHRVHMKTSYIMSKTKRIVKVAPQRSKEMEKRQKRQDSERTDNKSTEELIDTFHKTVSKGPCYVCQSCKQLWYKHSVVTTRHLSCSNLPEKVQDVIKKCIGCLAIRHEMKYICKTCMSFIKKGKIPPCAEYNKMKFPNQGPLKELNMLELSLLAPLLPFMRIHKAPQGQQMKIQGNMVLVPADVKNSVDALPRLPNDTGTIKAKLKRRLRYKSHIYSLNIRPEKVRAGLLFLSETSRLYREHNIAFDIELTDQLVNQNIDTDIDTAESFNKNVDELPQSFKDQTAEHNSEDRAENSEQPVENPEISKINEKEIEKNKKRKQGSDVKDTDDSDQWSETDENEVHPGILDTMLTAPDFVENSERDYVFSFAPAEGNVPMSVFLEKNSEELSFPGIFCGTARVPNKDRPVPVSYSEIVKSELRNSDRRAASCVENIFFKTKKLQMKQLIDQTQVVMRKYKTKGKTLTAKDVKGDNVKDYIHTDKAYKFMKSLRGSPPYFQAVSKDLFAMIRQLGPATFFMSLSAAETRWPHLLKILSHLVDNKELTEEEAARLSWQEKSRLIQSDPVTCARHFDFCVNKFFSDFLLSTNSPLDKIRDHFYRVEYQQRGSPHIHVMIWCENAPKYGEDPTEEVINYIDTYVSCKKYNESDDMSELVKYQTHRHSHTCRKKNRKQCRFGFPKPPLRKTEILEPLEPDLDQSQLKNHKNNWSKIQTYLKDVTGDQNITFDQFLNNLSLSENQYILAIRSSIRCATVFLRRTPMEIRVNNYNPLCLKAWRANMDLQYILDVYACASYIASYVTKSQRGMSELLRKACAEAKSGNQDFRQQVRTIGNKFLNAVEISAQEAVYICLGLPMRKSSRQVLFINTSPPDERVALLKPQNVIQNMKDDSEDIECSNLLTRYSERPIKLTDMTLAEYAAHYDTTKPIFISRSLASSTVDNLIPESRQSDNEENVDLINSTSVSDSSKNPDTKELKRRKTPRIIRYVHFNIDTDPEKYYREQIMLFHPWRDEKNDILGESQTYKQRYSQICDSIEAERLIYQPFRDAVDKAEVLIENIDSDIDEAWDNIAPNTEHMENIEVPPQTEDREVENYDMGSDLGVHVTRQEDELNFVYEIPDEEFRTHMRSLTKDQIAFVYDTINHLKTSTVPIYRFLSGGAGVGKSHVTKAIYQMAVKYYNKLQGEDFQQIKVLVLAPTGKAAYHVRGNTIHSALRIAANQKLEHRSLNTNSLNSFRNQFGHISLVIIDEISMVGFRMLNCIHQRLIELTQSKEDFGGISIIAVGDLFQLRPVKDSYIFAPPDKKYLQLATNLWKKHFVLYELHEIMRQKDSKKFAELLNRLREGQHSEADIACLSTRVVDIFSVNYPRTAVHLFTNNAKVNAHNAMVLSQSSNTVYQVKARDRVVNPISEEVKAKVLKSFETRKTTDTQLPTMLLLSEGFNYDITVNIDTQDGLTNGTSCKIMKIELQSVKCYPLGPIWVQYDNPAIGQHVRNLHKHRYKSWHNSSWTPLMPVSRNFAAGHKGELEIQRFQYPLRPAAAKTVHRSQGDTVSEAVVNLSLAENQKPPVDHIHYVALSRLKTFDGLYITDLNTNKISISKAVKAEMKHLRECKTDFTLQFLYNMADVFRITFLNARSLHRHLLDVKNDFNFQAAEVICFCETRFDDRDTSESTSLNGFHQYRQDSKVHTNQNQRTPYGMALYTSEKLHINPSSLTSDNIEIMLSEINRTEIKIILVNIYSPPKTTAKTLIKVLTNIHHTYLNSVFSVIMGDFNIDMNSDSPGAKQLAQQMTNLGYRQLITSPTCDTGSIIDLIFTNFPEDMEVRAGTLPVYYSDHMIIWAAIKS